MNDAAFDSLDALAAHLRTEIAKKKYILLYAYNGTGKTRLSMAFKDIGKQGEGEDATRDTLYFNAFTEDLFTWDNDLDNDTNRELRLNTASRFFNGLEELEMDTRIRDILSRYVDFDFKILTKNVEARVVTYVSFEKDVLKDGRLERIDNIKISRGEENVFIWSFFLAVVQLAFDVENPDDAYGWVDYIYIDDPISSLDENNSVLVACDLVKMFSDKPKQNIVISTHHTLFYNVLSNELKSKLGRSWERNLSQYYIEKKMENEKYLLKEEKSDSPATYHLSLLKELKSAAETNDIKVYHFNMLRNVVERTSVFFGKKGFGQFVEESTNPQLYARFLNLFSHGRDSIFSFRQPDDNHKEILKAMLKEYLEKYEFQLSD
ncbi:AAA family ATPase [Alcaligenes aquatilis]|uniref:AAA family ATPase n=1 Tax=Alcaligenes aquatilis TaxID=323284 RepID=UPI003D22915D